MKITTIPAIGSFFVIMIALIASSPLSHAEDIQKPYYGFFPSEKGQKYKKFVHNIFGFSIDIPSSWIFGVNGVPPTAVIFLYPEGLNTGKFSEDYETIEIGQISIEGITLGETQMTVMEGMRMKHSSINMVKAPKRTTLNGMSAISWIYEWPSRSGYSVVEYITLVSSSDGMRSIAVRTTRQDYTTRLSFYDGILMTFQPFRPKY